MLRKLRRQRYLHKMGRTLQRVWLSCAVVVALGVSATRAEAETIDGVVSRYSWTPAIGAAPGGPEVGLASRLVTLDTWTREETGACTATCAPRDPFCRRCGYFCTWQHRATSSSSSAADGSYSITYSKPTGTAQMCGSASPIPINSARVTVRTDGGETTNYSYTGSTSSSTGFTTTWNLRHAPELVSPNGTSLWARRLGSGSIPIVIYEPWDPGDGMKSSLEACPKDGGGQPLSGCLGVAEFLAGTRLKTTNFLSYLLGHDYSVWLLLHGSHGSDSIMGTAASGNTDGLAYQATYLAKNIRDTYHPGKDVVLGGYSMGGLLAQTGLANWCAGN